MSEIALYPYVRGYYPRDTLVRLWQHVEADGASRKLFWAQAGAPEERGDLEAFVSYFSDPAKRIVLVAAKNLTVLGMIWFDDIVPGYRAAMNVFYRRRAWAYARPTSRLAAAWAFDYLKVQALWGYSPWPEAVKHAEAIGFSRVALLPGFGVCDGTPLDITIVKMEKDAWASTAA